MDPPPEILFLGQIAAATLQNLISIFRATVHPIPVVRLMADLFGPPVGPVGLADNMIGPDIDRIFFACMHYSLSVGHMNLSVGEMQDHMDTLFVIVIAFASVAIHEALNKCNRIAAVKRAFYRRPECMVASYVGNYQWRSGDGFSDRI